MSIQILAEIIAPYKPKKSVEEIVVETNRIFHKYDAKHYDYKHPDMFQKLRPIYKQMCGFPAAKGNLKILNFGCGTGFEASQLLQNLDNIETLYCYDLSQEMLDVCRQKLQEYNKNEKIIFTNNLDDIPAGMLFNVLATNSLLHHLPHPFETIRELYPILSDDCYYLMGHEPSARHYKNTEIMKAGRDNPILARTMRRLLDIRKYPYYTKRVIGRYKKENPYLGTAVEVVENGLFELKPTREVVGAIVDCCVPRDASEADNGRGFDFHSMDLLDDWSLVYSKTYNYRELDIGRRKAKSLQEKYPDDGLNFCCVLKRKQLNIQD